MNNTEHTNNRGWTQVLRMGKQFLPVTRDPSCYLYSQYVLVTTLCKQTQVIYFHMSDKSLQYRWVALYAS